MSSDIYDYCDSLICHTKQQDETIAALKRQNVRLQRYLNDRDEELLQGKLATSNFTSLRQLVQKVFKRPMKDDESLHCQITGENRGTITYTKNGKTTKVPVKFVPSNRLPLRRNEGNT